MTMADMPPPFRASEVELQDQVMHLTQEKRELQEYAERITKELRRYQQARPPPPARPDDDRPLPPWATNMQMMSPLLYSYEERIAELEAVIDRSVTLAEQTQALAKENDTLRGELQDKTDQLRQAHLMAPVRDSAKDGVAAEQQDEFQDLYRLSIEQNEALAQQNQLLKLQIERMQQSLVAQQQQARDVQVAAQQQAREAQARILESTRAYSIEHERVESVASHKAAAEQRLEQVTSELVEDVRVREQLQLKFDSLQHELKLQKQSLEMYKKSFEDRCSLARDEEERLKRDLGNALQNEKEQRQRIASLEQELAEISQQFYVARREGDATKQEATGMLKLMESMERRFEDIKEQHDTAHSQLLEHEGEVRELLLERDKWTSSEQAARRQAERLESRLQDEADILRQQRDRDVESLQSTHRRLAAELEDKLKMSEQSASEQKAKVELLEKQRAWEAAALERQGTFATAERSRWQSDLDEAQQARLRAERHSDAAAQEAGRLKSELSTASSELREYSTRSNVEVANVQSKYQNSERSLSRAREEMQVLETRLSMLNSDHVKIKAELHEESFQASSALEAERRKAQTDRRSLERQLQILGAKARQEEQRAVELLRAQESLRQRWQAELGLEKDTLEIQVERLTAENRTLREKSRGILKAMSLRRIAQEGEPFT